MFPARFLMFVGAVVVLLALAIIGVGAYWRITFRTVEAAELARLDVDLSKAGEYTAAWHQVHQYGHDEGVELHLSPGFTEPEESVALVQGLAGAVSIRDAGGRVVYSGPLPHRQWIESGGPEMQRYKLGFVPLALFEPFPAGDYTLSVRVDKPATALNAQSQQVVGKHWLCGCEGLMASNLAFMLGVPVLLLSAVVFVGARAEYRAARRAAQYRQSPPHA